MSVWGGTGWFLVIWGGTVWYLVSLTWYCLVLCGTGLLYGLYASIY